MLQIKVGVELASMKLPFKKALLIAKQLGAQAVEIDARHDLPADEMSQTAVRQVRKMLEDLNLQVSAVSFRTRRGYHVLERLEERLAATRRAMLMAYQLGTNVVVNHIGRIPDETNQAAMTTLLEALSDLGRYGQKAGAFLTAETGTESGEQLAQLLSRLPPASIGVDLNPAQLIMNGHSPREAVQALAPYVMHVHAIDATRDVAMGRGFEVPLGQGSSEFPELLAALEEQQYRGFITVARREADDPVPDLRQGIEFLRNL